MAKISSIQKNEKRKKIVSSFESKRSLLKNQIMNKNISLEERFSLVIKLSDLPRDSTSIRVRNRCALTGRPRGYHRKMGVSRNVLRKLASQGLLPGVIKASW